MVIKMALEIGILDSQSSRVFSNESFKKRPAMTDFHSYDHFEFHAPQTLFAVCKNKYASRRHPGL